jgi:LmbE family N-acetylglucosaminyl deacetylase
MAANEPGQPDVKLANHRGIPEYTRNFATPESALAIGAHPDDVEFGCGGLLAKWAANGCTIHHLVCTDGSKGTWDVDADVAALAARRQVEQREAALRLAGSTPDRAGEVRFLGHVDGELGSTLVERGEVARVIREIRPQVVLGHDPWKRYRLHPDHRHAGLLACEGIVASRDPHFFPEHGLAHHRPDALLLWEADEPDHVEDVSDHVDTKLHALLAHESQFESTMKAVDDSALDAFRVRISERLSGLGAPHGLGAAEVYKIITSL